MRLEDTDSNSPSLPEVQICTHGECSKSGNEKLHDDFVQRFCVREGEFENDMVTVGSRTFRVCTYGCLGGCEGKRVNIVDPEANQESQTRAMSAEDLFGKLKKFDEGTLRDYFDDAES